MNPEREWRRSVGLFVFIFLSLSMGFASSAHADAGEDLYFSANALYNRKLYEIAIKDYETFLKDFPEHAKAANGRMGLALSYYAVGNYKAALPLLEQSVSENVIPDTSQLRLLLGQCELQVGEFEKAVAIFQVLTADDKLASTARADAYAGQVEALFMLKDWQAVVASSDALWALDPTGDRALRARFQGAAARHHLEQFKEAQGVLAAILDSIKDPALSHQAVFLLAECERENGDLDGAIAHYLAATQAKGGAFADQALFRLGFVQFSTGRPDEALASFDSFLKQHASHELAAQAQTYIGRCYLQKKNYVEAEAALKAVVEAAPTDVDAVLWLARVYSRSDRYADAANVLKPVAESAEGSPPLEILFDYANVRMAIEDSLGAAETFGKVYAKDATWRQAPEALRLKAVCLHRAGKSAESLAACAQFLAAHPDHANRADVTFLQAENQFLTGAKDVALASFNGFLKDNAEHSNSRAARMRLAQILYGQAKWADAQKQIALLPEPPSADPFFDQVGFIAGDCAYKQSQWKEAVVSLKAFADAHPKAPNADTARVKEALAYLQMDQNEDAAATFEGLLKNYPDTQHANLANVELGRLKYEAKAFEEAKTYLSKVAALADAGEEGQRAEYYLGWVACAEKDNAEAEKHFTRIKDVEGTSPWIADAQLQLGLLKIRSGAHEDAVAQLNTFLKNNPTHAKANYARFYLGVSLSRTRKYQEAVSHLQAIAEAKPASELADRARYEWAWCAKGMNDDATAMAQYQVLLDQYPKSELRQRAGFELSELESDAGKLASAIARLEKLIKEVKDNELRPQLLYRLGWCQIAHDAPETGLVHLEQLISEYPDSELLGLAHYHVGQTCLKRKEYTKSKKSFELAVAFKPPLASEFAEIALLRLGEVQGLTGDWAASLASCSTYVKTYPEGAWIRRAQLGQGWAQENLKHYEDAIASYTLVLKAAGSDETAARAQFQIGECYFALKDFDRALREFLNVEVKYPFPEWVSKSMLEMGRTLEQKGDKILAVEQYELLLQKFPDHDVAGLAKKRIAALSK